MLLRVCEYCCAVYGGGSCDPCDGCAYAMGTPCATGVSAGFDMLSKGELSTPHDHTHVQHTDTRERMTHDCI
jgi:hypothetical protein